VQVRYQSGGKLPQSKEKGFRFNLFRNYWHFRNKSLFLKNRQKQRYRQGAITIEIFIILKIVPVFIMPPFILPERLSQ